MQEPPQEDAGTPRWVKVSALAALALLALFVVLHLSGNSPGSHGP